MSKILRLAIALSLSVSALAQNHPEPGSAAEPPVICTGCPGNNFAGEPNDGKPTAAYDAPLVSHVGRYVDSSNTQNIQNAGIRTVRAGRIRVNVPRNRVYLQLGSAIGAYDLDSFFADKYVLETFVTRGRLTEPMVPVGGMKGITPKQRPNGVEKAARVDGFIYPEAGNSGWSTPFVDAYEMLKDFDADDRGYVYYLSSAWGWGIHHDDGRTDGTKLPFVAQVPTPDYWGGTPTLFTMKSGESYYVHTSDSLKTILYDVTVPATPVKVGLTRPAGNWVKAWAKNEAAGHVAVIQGTGILRVYTYAALITDGAPLVEHVPETGRKFTDVAFDELGNLWITDSTSTGSLLWKLSAGSYEKTTFPLGGTSFSADTLHTAAGYIAVAGRDLINSTRRYNLQLFEAASGTPQAIDTADYFRRYYHAAPAGFAQPSGYTSAEVRPLLFLQDGLVYLFYSAYGLGDVYEIGTQLRPPKVKITSISPASGPPAGGTTVTIVGRNFGPDSVVSFDGTAVATTFVSATQLSAVAPAHATGAVTVFVTSGGQVAAGPQFTYALPRPSNVVATGTSASTVTVTWTHVPTSTSYRVFRDGTQVTTVGGPSFNDGGRAADTAYIYHVVAVDAAGNTSVPSLRDLATTVEFSDATIVRNMTIKAVHLSDIRRAADAMRAAVGLPPATWTESAHVRAVQLEELRFAVNQARNAAGALAPPYTDSSLTGLAIRSVHMQELITAVR